MVVYNNERADELAKNRHKPTILQTAHFEHALGEESSESRQWKEQRKHFLETMTNGNIGRGLLVRTNLRF